MTAPVALWALDWLTPLLSMVGGWAFDGSDGAPGTGETGVSAPLGAVTPAALVGTGDGDVVVWANAAKGAIASSA